MVDGIERFLLDDGKGAGGECANKKRAEKTWSVSDGNGIDVVPIDFGVLEGLMNDW